MNNSSKSVRVKSIHISRLFGMYDHDVVLNELERMTVVHGPNGVGKTVLFKLTQDILGGAGVELLKYPFANLRVEFTNGATLVAEKKDIKDKLIQISIRFGGRNSRTRLNMDIFNLLAQRLEHRLPIHQIGPNIWFDPETDERLSAVEVVSRYSGRADGELDSFFEGELDKFRASQGYIPKVHLIEAQRLIKLKTSSSRMYRDVGGQSASDTVTEYSQQLKKKISSTLAEYGRQAQKLDQTFPQRLLQQGVVPSTAKKIELDLQQIEKRQEAYKQLGLIEDELSPVQGLGQLESDPVKLAAMTVYVTDMKAKLGVLEYLAQRISLLLNQINQKFTNKRLLINEDHELAIETSHGDKLSVSSLSSGEQHQIVLAYDMLFRIEANSLVMIDEPELSLHVNWQERFLSDLESVIDVANFDSLIATHSPYVINGRNELLSGLSAKDYSRKGR